MFQCRGISIETGGYIPLEMISKVPSGYSMNMWLLIYCLVSYTLFYFRLKQTTYCLGCTSIERDWNHFGYLPVEFARLKNFILIYIYIYVHFGVSRLRIAPWFQTTAPLSLPCKPVLTPLSPSSPCVVSGPLGSSLMVRSRHQKVPSGRDLRSMKAPC